MWRLALDWAWLAVDIWSCALERIARVVRCTSTSTVECWREVGSVSCLGAGVAAWPVVTQRSEQY